MLDLGVGRTPRSNTGKCDANPISCSCAEAPPRAYVPGTCVRTPPVSSDTLTSLACGVAAVMRHVISPVCAWKGKDIDSIGAEGGKLASDIGEAKQNGGAKWLCELVEEQNVFGRQWQVASPPPAHSDFKLLEGDTVMFEKLQEHLLMHGACLLDLGGAVNAIIDHNDHLVVVDCGVRDASGMASSIGISVVVLNTCLGDLMLHIIQLKESLDPKWYSVHGISVMPYPPDNDRDSATLFAGETVYVGIAAKIGDSISVRPETSVSSIRGTFHQGDARFLYGGLQCMAVSLVALAKHSINSVFSWSVRQSG